MKPTLSPQSAPSVTSVMLDIGDATIPHANARLGPARQVDDAAGEADPHPPERVNFLCSIDRHVLAL